MPFLAGREFVADGVEIRFLLLCNTNARSHTSVDEKVRAAGIGNIQRAKKTHMVLRNAFLQASRKIKGILALVGRIDAIAAARGKPAVTHPRLLRDAIAVNARQHHVFVIAKQEPGLCLLDQTFDQLKATLAVRPPVDNIAQEKQGDL